MKLRACEPTRWRRSMHSRPCAAAVEGSDATSSRARQLARTYGEVVQHARHDERMKAGPASAAWGARCNGGRRWRRLALLAEEERLLQPWFQRTYMYKRKDTAPANSSALRAPVQLRSSSTYRPCPATVVAASHRRAHLWPPWKIRVASTLSSKQASPRLPALPRSAAGAGFKQ